MKPISNHPLSSSPTFFSAIGRKFTDNFSDKLTANQWFLLLYLAGLTGLFLLVFLLKLAMKLI